MAGTGGNKIASSDHFLDVQPSIENHWRALILFGKNVASYKFALVQVLLEVRSAPGDLVKLEDLALPFALRICDHLRSAPRQSTSASSRFLQACRRANSGEISEESLRAAAVSLDFNNVIDAFHRLARGTSPAAFSSTSEQPTAASA